MFKIIVIGILSLGLISCSSISNSFSNKKIDPYSSNSRKITEEEISRILDESNSRNIATETNEKITEKISNSRQTSNTTTSENVKNTSNTSSKTTQTSQNKTSTPQGVVDSNFDETDQKIVDFIAEKVYENSEQIKKVTIDSLNILLTEKNIRMTKREFLARTYQIIRDNNMNSFYLAAGRLLNQL